MSQTRNTDYHIFLSVRHPLVWYTDGSRMAVRSGAGVCVCVCVRARARIRGC
jgi:hypothetical protein